MGNNGNFYEFYNTNPESKDDLYHWIKQRIALADDTNTEVGRIITGIYGSLMQSKFFTMDAALLIKLKNMNTDYMKLSESMTAVRKHMDSITTDDEK